MKPLFATAAIALSLLSVSAVAEAADRLSSGQSLTPNQSITSQNRKYRVILQTDGNVVLYDQHNKALWNSHTNGKHAERLVMQADGNLVLYGRRNEALWNTKTNGNPGAYFIIQDDGNAVVYNKRSKAVWSSRTAR